MTTLRFNKKQDLIDALETRRAEFEAHDKKMLAEHKAMEKAALAEFRAKCRASAKASYEDLKEDMKKWRTRQTLATVTFEPPTCPVSLVRRLDKTIKNLNLTRQERFTMQEAGTHSAIYNLLTKDLTGDNNKDMCS